MTAHAIDTLPKRKISRTPPRPRRRSANSVTSMHRRRAAEAAPRDRTAVALRAFWDEHAVKTGMVLFYAWFTVANFGHIRELVVQLAG